MALTFLNKPLTLERIQAAYQKTGFKPQILWYYDLVDDEPCGCPLGTIAVAEGFILPENLTISAANSEAFLAFEVEVNKPIPNAFMSGFDRGDNHFVIPYAGAELEAFNLGKKFRSIIGARQ